MTENNTARYDLAKRYRRKIVKNLEKIFDYYQKLADQNNAITQYNLDNYYYYGK
ncbi:17240_t:CDS:1, partial [Funneliformis geosporum]